MALVLLASACTLEVDPSSGSLLTADCDVAATGTLDTGDDVDGNLTGSMGSVTGSWTHTSSSLGTIELLPGNILCRINGVLHGDLDGPATVRGAAGYSYILHVEDLGTPGEPSVLAGPPEVHTLTATRHTRPTRWDDGVLGLGAPARITIPAELTVTEGTCRRGLARLTLDRGPGDQPFCHYRGNAAGDRLVFDGCQGASDAGSLAPGWEVDVNEVTLRVQTDGGGTVRFGGRTTATVDLMLYRLTVIPPVPDFYSLRVFDSSGAEMALLEGDLVVGDLTVARTTP